jgi:hypothetical protein
VPVFDQRSLVNVKEKRQNRRMAEDKSHSIIPSEGPNLRYGNGPEVLKDMAFVLNPGSFHSLTMPWRLERLRCCLQCI